MGAEFDGDAVHVFEGVGEQHQLALGIDAGALGAGGVPGGADLDPAMRCIGIHVGGHAAQGAGIVAADHEGQHAALLLQMQAAFDLGAHVLRLGDGGVPELPELAVGDGGDERIMVLGMQRLDGGELALQGDR